MAVYCMDVGIPYAVIQVKIVCVAGHCYRYGTRIKVRSAYVLVLSTSTSTLQLYKIHVLSTSTVQVLYAALVELLCISSV